MKKKIAMMTTALAAMACVQASAAERGSDGQLNIIFWQAVSVLNPFISSGNKDVDAAALVLEGLAKYDDTGTMVPVLVDEIPTVENGGVAADLTSITWKLTPGIIWSDGTPLTAKDVVFTGEYCMDPKGACQQVGNFGEVAKIEAVDDLTVKVTFSGPKAFPYGPFVGSQSPILQSAQFADCLGEKMMQCTDQNFSPIGTGPFKVAEFKANDVVTFEANPNYREAGKPAFASVTIKGGGDSASAARSVLETGEFDYAWRLQIEPEILAQMTSAGKGKTVVAFGSSVERLELNLTDPDPALGDKRSTIEGGMHPFNSDPAVRKALSLAIDRSVLVDAGYGESAVVTCNIVPAPAAFASVNNDWCKEQDVDAANKLLDEAGWLRGSSGVREKDGKRLSILLQTSTNSVRQAAQALIKDMWQQIGVETELRNIDGSVFFGGDPASPDTAWKLYADVQMYMDNFAGVDPEQYLAKFVCSNIPSPATNWGGGNMQRYCDPEYEALIAELSKTAGVTERGKLAIKLNDMLVDRGGLVPLIYRGTVSAHANSLEGVKANGWDADLWNVADWTRAD